MTYLRLVIDRDIDKAEKYAFSLVSDSRPCLCHCTHYQFMVGCIECHFGWKLKSVINVGVGRACNTPPFVYEYDA